MGDFRILIAGKEQAEYVAPFMGKEAADALKKGLPITVFAAADKDGVAGVLSGVMDKNEFIIDSIFVDKAKRGRGAGTALMEALYRSLPDEDLAVTAEFNMENEDSGTLESFLSKEGFEEEEQGYPRLYMGSVKGLISGTNKIPEGTEIKSFGKTDERLLRVATNISMEEGYLLPEKGLLSDKADRETSFCLIKDGAVPAYVVIESVDDMTLKVPALFSSATDPRETMLMLNMAAEAIKAKYSEDTKIAMLAINPASEKIVEYLFDEVTLISRSYIKYI